ncbi:AAA family ATPase [Microbispora sp. NEAU-D428]|uniref:nucleotide-binding protein n=1 Tax=Microbispora sitophila TaxID=2771537 RepID=UPI001866F5A1|nr:AAA family ATPase [Microbispora sitophila]MBE3008314.1 AAA family ATPase [Microbispora sitophila]
MPDEVEIAVSAVTSATLASPPPPPQTDPEPASPYPADPWSLVPAEPASGGLLRGTADSATGSAYGAPAQEDAQTSEASSTGPVREPFFGAGYSESFGYESSEKSGFGSGYGADSAYGERNFGDTNFGDTTNVSDTTAFGDTTAFVTRPESSPSEEREDPSPAESPSASTAFGTPPETRGEESATSTGPVSAPSFGSSLGSSFGAAPESSFGESSFGAAPESSFGQAPDRSAESSFPGSFGASSGAGSESPAASSGATPETPGDDQESPEGESHPTTPPGGLSGSSSFTTPLFGERASGGAFPGSPADTDAYKNIGAFSGSEPLKPFASPASGSTKEPLRGWLEPAVPVPAAQQEPAAPAEPEEPPAPPEIPSPFATPQAETAPDFADDRFTGSLREDLAAEERKPYEPGPIAAPTPLPAPAPAPLPAPERASAPSPAPDQAPAVERDAVAEREAYQPPRRPAPPVSAFSSPARTTGRSAGSKPTADSLDPVTLLRGRRNAPATGWRRLVYKASAGLIKPGEAPEVRRRRELVQRARTPVATGHHRVAVLSLKGGVGKTTTTVGLGATLAQVRGDRVIAVDANPDRGTLSDKVELETAATVRDLLNERAQIKRYVDIRAFTSQTPSRLEILASDRDPSVSEAFSAKDYHAVANVLENFYSICITDCGTGLLHSAMSGVLGMADQIVLVSSPSVDGARAASATLDWLEAHHYGDLVRAATVVLCSVRPRSKSTVDLDKLEAHFAARCRTVVRVPYDAHLEEGAEIDLDRLQQATRDAYLRLAASVGDGFAGPQALAEPRFSEIPDHL